MSFLEFLFSKIQKNVFEILYSGVAFSDIFESVGEDQSGKEINKYTACQILNSLET